MGRFLILQSRKEKYLTLENIDFGRTLFEETRFMNLHIKSMLSKIVASHGLNPYQAHLLGDIATQGGQTIKDLARHLCVKPSNFKPIAEPLAQRGLIERRQDEEDKRIYRIFLTEKGREESASIDAEFASLFERGRISEELQEQILKGFEAFHTLIELNSDTITSNLATRKEH